ncbi:unnamed protein product [Caenorhabditis brenneri]
MGLPLLRLPHLVITNLVDITEIEDLTCLLLCSNRARKILIVCRRQNLFEDKFIFATVLSNCTALNVSCCQIEVIQISNLEKYMKIGYSNDAPLFSERTVADVKDEIGQLESVEIGGQRVPFFRDSETLLTFWDDETIGFRKCMDFARETFGMPVKLLVFSAKGMWAFDWINGWEEKIQQMTVEINGIQDHELKYIMEKCESRMLVTRGGLLCSEGWDSEYDSPHYPSESFQFDLYELKTKCFFASSARWITVQNISTSFLEALEIGESSMTNRDLNLFLRLWLVGGFPCLRYIFIRLCEWLTDDATANGVKNELRQTTYQHEFPRKSWDEDPYEQFDVQQKENGNKMASIRFSPRFLRSVGMSVWE